MVKSACQWRRLRKGGFDPWFGKIPWRGAMATHSYLENPMDRGPWWAVAHRVAKCQTWLNDWAHIAKFHSIGNIIYLNPSKWNHTIDTRIYDCSSTLFKLLFLKGNSPLNCCLSFIDILQSWKCYQIFLQNACLVYLLSGKFNFSIGNFPETFTFQVSLASKQV